MQNEAGKVVGAHCRDRISGKEFDVHAKLVINAAGPFADDVRRASDPSPLSKCERPITSRPRSTQAEIDFILNTLSDYLDVRVTPKDVLSAWCGIRPLPNSGKGGNTQNVVRDHGRLRMNVKVSMG
eukprot:451797-Pelagomonas_calceolata.AAC.4